MNNMNEMAAMMENMKKFSEMMEKFAPMMEMFQMMSGGNSMAAAVAPTEQKETKPTFRKLTLEDFEEESTPETTAELGAWQGVTAEGKTYTWYGWADPNTGKRKFPGKQLFHVNDFYLKRDYGAYHPGKTTAYKFKDGGAKAFIANYKVRTEVDAKDAKAFIKFMQDKEASKVAKVHDTPDTYANWCNHSK